MAYRDVYKMSDEQLGSALFDILYSNPEIRRKELIERCIEGLGFSAEELSEHGTASPVIRAKSRIGMVLSSCIKSGAVTESETGKLTLIGFGKRFISREKVSNYTIEQLERFGTLTKKQLFLNAEKDFGTDATPDKKDDNDLRAAVGKALQRLEEEGHIIKTRTGYTLTLDNRYPNTEMGGFLREAALGGNIRACFLKAIHIKGGEWFESYCVDLLESYYRATGKTVLSAAVTGGSDDGGIDGVIKTQDYLGYRETILMQMKNRNAIISSKDVREFYGAVCAENGSRGIFVTISEFHSQAGKLLDKVDNLIGIDGEKLFDIARQCGKGVLSSGGSLALDEEMFLKS